MGNHPNRKHPTFLSTHFTPPPPPPAQAFGYDGLGILAVRGVPGFVERRAAALPFAHRFGTLPPAVQSRYEHSPSTYSFGWSHGKEKLEGKPDTAKGSYYFNPTFDRPVDDEALIALHAPFIHPNIWPSPEVCPGFEEALKACGQLLVDVGLLLAASCDAYVRSRLPASRAGRLHEVIRTSRCTKARLLFYFPTTEGGGGGEDGGTAAAAAAAAADAVSSWCGWHNDHGSLTGLTPAMYFDAEGREIPCPDPAAGLYIRSRQGDTVRVAIPSDCIAYQIGETSQVHSGGVLQATPHCVRAAEGAPGVSRGTLAVFMEPMWDEPMDTPEGADPESVLRGARGELLPKGVPPLVARWDVGGRQTFGDFTDRTLGSYY